MEQASELPGVAADEEFGKELEGKRLYFLALKCSAIAQSHAVLSNRLNALALYSRALTHVNTSLTLLPPSPTTVTPNSIDITSTEVKILQRQLEADVTRYHALAEMDRLTAVAAAKEAKSADTKPLIERLDRYPEQGVDFGRLATYPPRVEPIPVKPIFFDIAWNFIEYPGQEKVMEAKVENQKEAESGQKKGLFSFWGR